MTSTKAVLTGDFIGSSETDEQSLLIAMTALEGCADAAGATFDRHRGDGWQIYLRNALGAYRLTLHILANLKAGKSGLQTRISIGVGPATLPQGDLAAGSGPAFEQSGRGLDHMPARQRLAIAGEDITALHTAVLALSEGIADHWTPEQARAISEALPPTPGMPGHAHQIVADRLGITRQAVQERLSRAGYNAIQTSLAAWESEDD